MLYVFDYKINKNNFMYWERANFAKSKMDLYKIARQNKDSELAAVLAGDDNNHIMHECFSNTGEEWKEDHYKMISNQICKHQINLEECLKLCT